MNCPDCRMDISQPIPPHKTDRDCIYALRDALAETLRLMQEAFDNCETCRYGGGIGRCARCETFRMTIEKYRSV